MPLSQVIGHPHVVDLLRRAVLGGSVPQSLLFAGPSGVGKRRTALALAQAVNCPTPQDGDACGECRTCRRIAAGTFSDVVALDKGGEASIKIDALRERVLAPIGYRPFEGRRRVFIIEPADDLTVQAQDALLKTLEEPPPAAVLILVSASPDSLLPTVRSRCRRVRFGHLADQDVVRILTGPGCRVDPVEARHRAVLAGGSVERALAVDGRDFVEDRDAALGLLRATIDQPLAVRLKAAAAFAQVDKKRRVRDVVGLRLELLASLVRDLLVVGIRSRGALANTDVADQLESLSSRYSAERLSAAFAAVQQAEASIGRNASPKIVADWLAVSL